MATNNAVDTSLSGQTGTGNFVGATSPTITTPTVVDSNGNNALTIGTTGSAVNYLEIFNRATGAAPYISSVGSDSNIGLLLNMKGTGILQVGSDGSSPVEFLSGTAQQHTAVFAFANAATSQTITFPDTSYTVAANSGFTAWTPVFTFATPGNLSVSYATQVGSYVKVGNHYTVTFSLVCTPTFSTASGNFQITGLPVASNSTAGNVAVGSLYMQGTYTWPVGSTTIVTTNAAGTSIIGVQASGIATAAASLTTASFTTTSAVTLIGTLTYLI